MKKTVHPHSILNLLLILLLLIGGGKGFAQTTTVDDGYPVSSKLKGIKRFQAGLYIGSYFANDYTASLYDGYGYDIYNNKSDFTNSAMYRAIVNDYGGGNGQPDRIALALKVDHNDWHFDDPSDMPANLAYSIAFIVGVHTRYMITKQDAIIFNVNAAKLTANGNFTITLTNPPNAPQPPDFVNTRTFAIKGSEQRVMFQLGYQRITGEDAKINFFYELGATCMLAKFNQSSIMINNLFIDLTSYYNQPQYIYGRPSILTGIGFGGFGGLGFNFSVHKNLVLQLLYSPSYEVINIGDSPKATLQQAVGLRAYGKL